MRIKQTTLITVAAFTVGLAGLGFGVANAITSTPVYHGCVVGTSRTLEHVYTAKTPTCPSGSFAAKWNQVGQQGPQGPTGPQGATGPAGPAGPSTAGLEGLQVTVATAQTTNNGTFGGSARVLCPTDHPYIISGGSTASNDPANPLGGADAPIKDSYAVAKYQDGGISPPPPGPEGGFVTGGWYVDYGPTFDGARLGTVYVWAICAK